MVDATDIAFRQDMSVRFIEKLSTNEQLVDDILLSDEAHFTLSGVMNSKNNVCS